MFVLFADDGSLLYQQMISSYTSSIAPGTADNRQTQAKTFLKFALYYGVPVLCPSIQHICMYVQYLSNSFAAPTLVKNYLSGARSWIVEHGGDTSSFNSPVTAQLVSGLNKRSQHVPVRAEPLFWEHIRHIVDFLRQVPNVPLSVKPCLLIGYHTFLRSSNLLSPSTGVWGGPHTLLAKHIRLSDKGLHISVSTTKTKYHPAPVSMVIPWNNDPVYFPAQAWLRYVTARRPCPIGPAFVTDDHRPLTPRHIVGFMSLALENFPGISAERVTFHSLRRGAAQQAKALGISLENIMERGMWKSRSGVAPYLK